jgi:hypothetical protein
MGFWRCTLMNIWVIVNRRSLRNWEDTLGLKIMNHEYLKQLIASLYTAKICNADVLKRAGNLGSLMAECGDILRHGTAPYRGRRC